MSFRRIGELRMPTPSTSGLTTPPRNGFGETFTHTASKVFGACSSAPLSVPIGVIGIGFGLRSIRLLRFQVDADILAAKAAQNSADIANKSLLILERARIFVSHFIFLPQPGGTHFRYRFEVINIGNTPGTITERQCTYWPTDKPLPITPPSIGEIFAESLTVYPGQKVSFLATELHPLDAKQEIYIVGILRYTDVFGNGQETRFCSQYVPNEPATIVTQAGYNTAT
jgi:hypothetical protein